MTKYFIAFLFITSILHINAQGNENDSIIVADNLSSDEFYSIQTAGWIIVDFNSEKSICNFSNEDYVLYFNINCTDAKLKPTYLIEYSNNYRDGNYGGLDFTSSKKDTDSTTVYLIDDIAFDNPFTPYDAYKLDVFLTALKTGKVLTMSFYYYEYDIVSDADELTLNRTISFQLKNNHLLNTATNCK
ncbi:hypothetical protein [Crocinitomix catalasitica]|uniref:hypothetical protein n=1 Tax=Crocinitomix catalasitica TaxID=184607 RepID=UPI0012F9D5C3|nr:hypothetical protein [Crocinitomix catalasitica]